MLGKRFTTGGEAQKMYSKRDFRFEYGHCPPAAAAIECFDEANRREFFLFLSPPLFTEFWFMRPLRNRINRTLMLVGFGKDDANGELNWDGKHLNLNMPNQQIIGKIYSAMRLIAQGYGRVGAAPTDKQDSIVQPQKARLTAHPLGGCRMGETIETGVVDHRGEVFGYPGLYIADASVFCGPPVCAPSLVIASLSRRISDMIIKEEKGC
jgi:hypothetical protein